MIDVKTKEELKAKYPNRKLKVLVASLPPDDGETEEKKIGFVVAAPTRPEYQRMIDEIMDPQKRGVAVERFVRGSIKHPAPAEVDAIAARFPAIFSQLSDPLTKLAGNAIQVEEQDF